LDASTCMRDSRLVREMGAPEIAGVFPGSPPKIVNGSVGMFNLNPPAESLTVQRDRLLVSAVLSARTIDRFRTRFYDELSSAAWVRAVLRPRTAARLGIL
jgi:hypothetical protein